IIINIHSLYVVNNISTFVWITNSIKERWLVLKATLIVVMEKTMRNVLPIAAVVMTAKLQEHFGQQSL
ncbi:hypothetical protein, partial [Vibrio eleionomae]|uniref:hypothetical protein n=1 Tax=Vibrio eleionomae TaxID=2653505 RepID=UPI001F4182F8